MVRVLIHLLILFFRHVFNAYVENSHKHVVCNNKFLICSCGESTFDGVPCRHELALCALKLKNPCLLWFERRWEISFFSFEEQNEENKEDLQGKIH